LNLETEMSNVHANPRTDAIIATLVLPSHLTAEALAAEAEEYAESYSVSIEIAIRDVIDQYHQGAAEEADAFRNGDLHWGRE
jgi:hypothetical protein